MMEPLYLGVFGGLLGLAAGFILWLWRQVQAAKRNQELLLEERESFERMLQEANDALFVIDTVNGRVMEVNKQAAALLGYSVEELRQKTIFELHPQDLLQKSSERIADVWEQKGMVYDDLPFRRKNGELVPIESSAKVVPYRQRPAILVYARDITLRLALQHALEAQARELEEKNNDLTDSIVYARRIQAAILPETDRVVASFPDSFILYMPKDIVSGDFYWHVSLEGRHYFAVADCTGHGVPGAFMSMLGSTLLREIARNKGFEKPSSMLGQLHKDIRTTLKQGEGGSGSLDGMDIALLCYDPTTRALHYAGAMRPLVYFRKEADGTFTEHNIRADRVAIGGSQTEAERVFTDHAITTQPGDIAYLYTDGYPDQFGGAKGRKFMDRKLKRLLEELAPLPMDNQKQTLRQTFLDWRGEEHEQVDDVLLAGIRF